MTTTTIRTDLPSRLPTKPKQAISAMTASCGFDWCTTDHPDHVEH